MMSPTRFFRRVFLPAALLPALLLTGTLRPSAKAADPPRRQLQRTLENVRPDFHITPIVHDLEARRGQLLRFEYTVEAMGADVTLEVRPCALQQEENGVVLPDTLSPAPSNIQMETPAVLEVKASQRVMIKGRLRVPPTNTTFHSFGILVKNAGGKPLSDNAPVKPGERRLKVKFVTQYLLRCDIRVIGARGSALRDLEVKSAELRNQDGHAQARVLVHNPTESPLEFETRCRLRNVEGAVPRQSFSLVLPVRSSLEEPERLIARILPKATVRVENLLPHPVFSGQHELTVELHSRGRVQQRAEFPLEVKSGNFPAQDATVVQVARDLVVSPSQLELSLQSGGKRFVALTIENTSLQRLTVNLSKDLADESQADWLSVHPTTLEVSPGRRAKALIRVQSGFDVTSNQYAALRVDVTPEVGSSVGSQTIPVALLARTDEQPVLDAGEIRWTDEAFRNTLAVTMTNRGTRHAELNPQLRLTDSFGRAMLLNGGYGKWLLPGESAEVHFPLIAVPPPGTYRAQVVHENGDNEPIVLVAGEVFVP